MKLTSVLFSLSILALSFLILIISQKETEQHIEEAYSRGYIDGAESTYEKLVAEAKKRADSKEIGQ